MDALTAFLAIFKAWMRSPLNLSMEDALLKTQDTIGLMPKEYEDEVHHEFLVSIVECMIESRLGYATTPYEAVRKAAEMCKPMQEAAKV